MTVQYTMNTDEDQSLIHILMFVRIMLIHYIKWKYCIQNTLYDNCLNTCIVCLPLIINIKFSKNKTLSLTLRVNNIIIDILVDIHVI
jgi:hypothetical protein